MVVMVVVSMQCEIMEHTVKLCIFARSVHPLLHVLLPGMLG
jgi:hypothetical protein